MTPRVATSQGIGASLHRLLLDATTTICRVPDAPIVIINPSAGGGRAAQSVGWIRDLLTARPGTRLEMTRRRGDAERLSSNAGRDGHDRIIAVGGDGTIAEVVNGLMAGGAEVELGIVPAGSGNDLARSLGLPRDPVACWTIGMQRHTRPIDLARVVNGAGASRWLVSAGGIGFDAQVAAAMAERARWQQGRAGYVLTTLSELLRFSNRSVEITVDGGAPLSRHVLFVAIANGANYGGGMRIAPDAQVDDGWLDLCIVGNISRLGALRQMPNLYRGTHTAHPAVELLRARTVHIAGDAKTRVHLDGEPFGELPLSIELVPARLCVAAPLR